MFESCQEYVPEIWAVKKDDIYSAIDAIQNGLEYARELLAKHEKELGRTTLSNRRLAEMMEKDIQQMEKTLEDLRECPLKELLEKDLA